MLLSVRPNLKINFCLWLTLALGIAWAGPELSPELSPAEKALGEAVRAGDVAQVQAALDRGVNPNILLDSVTPLWVAAEDGNTELVKLLLQGGADPNLVGPHHGAGSPLFQAAREGYSEVVGLLLEAGADPDAGAWRAGCEKGANPNARDKQGRTALMLGGELRYGPNAPGFPIAATQLLLAFGADPNLGAQPAWYRCAGHTPLMAASSPKVVELLLDAGADPNMRDCQPGPNPLFGAGGDPDTVKLLLAAGADPNAAIPSGPMTYETPLMSAVRAGNLEAVKLLLAAGAQVRHVSDPAGADSLGRIADRNGTTPLMAVALASWQSSQEQLEVATKLIELDPLALGDRDIYGHTALHYALEAQQIALTRLLLDSGAEPNELDACGYPGLWLALDDGLIEPILTMARLGSSPRPQSSSAKYYANTLALTRLLLEYGADPQPGLIAHRESAWINLLLGAVTGSSQSPELATLLSAYGADPDSGSFDGKTPLIHAVQNKDLELVKALIQGGASLDAPDHSGKTALIYATQNQDLDLVKALLAAGARIDRYDLEDKTALDYARQSGNQELIELLTGAKP